MSSRAVLLLQREDEALRHDAIHGIQTRFVRNNPFDWEVIITGPEQTPWEGGIFKVSIRFDENYDELPPCVGFITVPFHPNVDMNTGRPHIPLLDDPENCWKPTGGLRELLILLRATLSSPLATYPPANVSAYECWIDRPHLYEQLTRDCVVASQRIAAGLFPSDDDPSSSDQHVEDDLFDEQERVRNEEEALRKKRMSSVINFEDYYSQWKMTATSVPTDRSRNGRLLLHQSPRLKLTIAAVNDIAERQHDILYGRFPDISKQNDMYGRRNVSTEADRRYKAAKEARINNLKCVYQLEMKPRLSESPNPNDASGMDKSIDTPDQCIKDDWTEEKVPTIDPIELGPFPQKEEKAKESEDALEGMEGWEQQEADELVRWSSRLADGDISL